MENTNFNLRIKRLPYSKMLKSEMADYVEKTIDIVGNHDIESELIAPMVAQLDSKKPDIKLLRLSYGIDTERLRVSKLKSELMLVISAFKIQVRLLSKSEPELDMHQIQNAINKHLRYLNKCKNDKQLSQKIAGFFDLLDADEALETALSEFELTREVNEMRNVFSTMEEASRKRVTLLSQRPIISTRDIVRGMKEAVDNLFKGIEVGNMIGTLSDDPENDPVDFAPLIEELNQLSEMYYRSISIRDANNKRKANGEDDVDDESIDEPEDEGTTNMQTTGMNYTGDGYEPMGGRIAPFSTMAASLGDEDTDELFDEEEDDDFDQQQ